RNAVDEDPLARVDGWRHRALEPACVRRGHEPVLLELVDLVVRLRLERLALVERQRAREVVAPLGHDGGNALHRLGALEGGTPCPPAPGGVRRRNRSLGISTGAFRDSAEALPRRRARRARGLAGLAVDPLARD